MATVDDLTIKILADGSQLESGLNKAQNRVEDFSLNIKKLGETVGIAFSVTAVEEFIRGCVNASDASERAIAKVAQAIKTTNGVAGQSLEDLKNAADDFKRSTLFDDDTVLNDVSAQLLTFTNITGENFKKAQQSALDLATVLGDGEGLRGVSIQLGKALNDPVQGLNALRRSGISFSTDQVETIKNLTETNRLAEAQSLILNELNRQYGGQAKAAADASNGIVQFTNSVDDGRKAVGKMITEGGNLKALLQGITAVATITFDSNIPGSFANLAKSLYPFANHTEITSTKVLGKDKPNAAAEEASTPETTYDDLIAKLHQYQEAFKSSTVETRAGITQQIEDQKRLIKEWEDAGKSVENYTGTLRGLGLEISKLQESRDLIPTTNTSAIVSANLHIQIKQQEKKELESASQAWWNYGKTVGTTIDQMVPKYTKLQTAVVDTFAHVYDANNKLWDKMKADNANFSKMVSDNLTSAISSVATSLGTLIGDLINGSKSAGDSLMSFLGRIIGQVGQMAIGIGTAMLAINLTLSNPNNPYFAIGLIAAGVAAVALGQVFSNQSKAIASGGGGGGDYGSGTGSNNYDTRGVQPSAPQIVSLTLQGRDLVAAIELNKLYYNRQG